MFKCWRDWFLARFHKSATPVPAVHRPQWDGTDFVVCLLAAAVSAQAVPARAADLATYALTVTTTGAEGSATGTGTTSVMLPGYLESVYIDYATGATGSTDVTLSYATRGGNILAVSNSLTDTLYAPRIKPVDNANAAITNAFDRFPLWDKVTVAVAQAATPSVTVYLRVFRP